MTLHKRGVLKRQVEQILQDEPSTRNCDIKLASILWCKFYPTLCDKIGIRHTNQLLLPEQASIKRERQKFNEQKMYLPTDKNVAKKRRINEDVWREHLGYPPKGEGNVQ